MVEEEQLDGEEANLEPVGSTEVAENCFQNGDAPSAELLSDVSDFPSPSEFHHEPSRGSERNESSKLFDFSAVIADASQHVKHTDLELPWETPEWKCIFDQGHNALDDMQPPPFQKLKRPKFLDDYSFSGNSSGDVVAAPRHVATHSQVPAYAIAVKRRRDLYWTEKRESELQRALKKWYAIVSNWPPSCECSLEITKCATMKAAFEMLGDYLSGKAPATLVKRANSLIFFQNVAELHGIQFPYSESDFYHVLKQLKHDGYSSSRLKSVIEAITFVRYSFQIDTLHGITTSKRCLGAVRPDPAGKVNQAESLSVSDIEMLHSILTNAASWDSAFAGACLFCVYSRARWSDFCHGQCLRLDKNADGTIAYADMEVYIHKTMRASANRFRFLDLVATGNGISGFDWIAQWIMSMERLGIDPFSAEPGNCLMPAPGADGHPLRRALESDECSTWLRLLLGQQVTRASSRRKYSSHSLKASLLSFAAKRGLSHEDRLCMGHHMHPFRMADTYARDAQARVIRLVDKLILEIRAGYFLPDCNRAGRFNRKIQLDSVPDLGASAIEDDEELQEDIAQSVSDAFENANHALNAQGDLANVEDEKHLTSSSSDSSNDSDEMCTPGQSFMPPVPPKGCKFMQHRRTKTLHIVESWFPHGTRCGRTLDANHIAPTNIKFDSAVCNVCNRPSRWEQND